MKNCLFHFLPDVREFLDEQNIKCYSAKNLYDKHFPLIKWKAKCFKKLILENFHNKKYHLRILVIGDSKEEKQAAMGLMSMSYYAKIKVNFLKTAGKPDILTIIKQISITLSKYDELLISKQFYNTIESMAKTQSSNKPNKK